jgi:alpha-glucosidase (family GH31 glycosyl hydrolase)
MDIPVRFGSEKGGVGSNKTLPETSEFYIGRSLFSYVHIQLHLLYGSKLTM